MLTDEVEDFVIVVTDRVRVFSVDGLHSVDFKEDGKVGSYDTSVLRKSLTKKPPPLID